MIKLFVSLLLLAGVPAFLVTAQDRPAELPVTKVVLFSSGVGYFEHNGTVDGTVSVPFVFQIGQINDVLKSMVLRDSTGSVSAVNYPSQDPLDRALKSFAVDISGPGGLASLLPQLRGVEMTLTTPAEITGRLLGVEVRDLSPSNPETKEVQKDLFLTLSTGDGLRTFPLSSVTQMKILDPKLNDELTKALGLLSSLRDNQRKTVTVKFSGSGKRNVSAGYISEAPVWKTSYRLDLTGDKPYLQGWAIVENTSETDWNNVSLSLVSGRPVSFIQDLYSPLYVERPIYTPELEAGPAPRINEEGMPPPSSAPAAEAAPMPQMSTRAAKSSSLDMEDEDQVPAKPNLRNSGVQASATGGKAGELFQFTVKTPVSLPRRQSALLPLTSGDVKAEKVSLFNVSVLPKNPMNAVWITNSTGLRLPAGPITVFDGGIYAGDALTDSLVENDKRLWTYATDLSVLVDTSSSFSQTTTKINIVRGVLNFQKSNTYTQKYGIQNKASEKKTLLIEHPLVSGRSLLQPAAFEEKTDSVYRFRTSVDAGKTNDFTVVEKEIVYESQGILGQKPEDVLSLIKSSGPLSAAAKDALQKAADLRVKADRLTQEVAALNQQKSEEVSGQARLRSNIDTVGRSSEQGQTYLKKLMDSEAKIDALDSQVKDKRLAQTAAQKDLEDYLRNLNVE